MRNKQELTYSVTDFKLEDYVYSENHGKGRVISYNNKPAINVSFQGGYTKWIDDTNFNEFNLTIRSK